MIDDTAPIDTDQPLARDDGPQSEDYNGAPAYMPLAVEFAEGAS